MDRTAAEAAGVPVAANRRKLVPWIVYLIFFAVLNETVFNVSTPVIARQFSLSPSGVSWMMTIFMVFFGIGSVMYGKLADLYSLRGLIAVGVGIYAAGSLAGFLFRFSYPLVVAARALQGIGGSAIPALAFVVVARLFAPSQRGRVFGLVTSTVSLAIGIGPVIGGFVAARLDWSYLFLIPLPILVAVPFLRRGLPVEPRREGTVDALGAALVALVLGTLIVSLNFGRWFWLAGSALLLGLFALRIRRARDPFIEPSLFRNVRFRGGIIVGFAVFFVVIGVIFLIPIMLSSVHGLSTGRIGLVLFPGAISSVAFGPIAGRLADRRGNRSVVSIGLALIAASLVIMALLHAVSYLVVGAGLLLTYVGFALFQTAMVNSVSQSLQGHETGVGMGLFNLVGVMSGAIGTAVVGKLLAGGWLDAALLPVPTMTRGLTYSNLMIIFAAVVALGGVVYARSYRPLAATAPLAGGRAKECSDDDDLSEPERRDGGARRSGGRHQGVLQPRGVAGALRGC